MKSTGKLHEAPKVQVAAPCDTLVAQKCRSNAEVFDSLLNHVRFHCLRVKEVREEDLTIFDLHFHDIAVRPPFRFKN